MEKIIYILPLLLLSIEGFSIDKSNENNIPKKQKLISLSDLEKKLHMHKNPEAHYMLEGDPIEYLFGMIHRNLNKIYKKCGRYPTEKEMPEALLKGEIKKLNCQIDGSLPDWKNHGNKRYKNFEEFSLGKISFEEKRFKYFSNHEKFIMTYKAPDDFIQKGKVLSPLRFEYYSHGYLSSSKGKQTGERIRPILDIVDACEYDKKFLRAFFCHIGKRKIIQYKEFD